MQGEGGIKRLIRGIETVLCITEPRTNTFILETLATYLRSRGWVHTTAVS
jgi:hypothetical protein